MNMDWDKMQKIEIDLDAEWTLRPLAEYVRICWQSSPPEKYIVGNPTNGNAVDQNDGKETLQNKRWITSFDYERAQELHTMFIDKEPGLEVLHCFDWFSRRLVALQQQAVSKLAVALKGMSVEYEAWEQPMNSGIVDKVVLGANHYERQPSVHYMRMTLVDGKQIDVWLGHIDSFCNGWDVEIYNDRTSRVRLGYKK